MNGGAKFCALAASLAASGCQSGPGAVEVRALANPVLRHRILTNFHAQSERVSTSQVIEQLLAAVPVPTSRL